MCLIEEVRKKIFLLCLKLKQNMQISCTKVFVQLNGNKNFTPTKKLCFVKYQRSSQKAYNKKPYTETLNF